MKRPLATLLLILPFAAPARAAQCGGDFNVFLSAMARDAQAAGLRRGIGIAMIVKIISFSQRLTRYE
jgi:hypothetical protein